MTHPPFLWAKPRYVADDAIVCEWMDLVLWAQPDGQWRVNRLHSESCIANILVTHEDQRPGADLQDAKRMAQAVAMNLLP